MSSTADDAGRILAFQLPTSLSSISRFHNLPRDHISLHSPRRRPPPLASRTFPPFNSTSHTPQHPAPNSKQSHAHNPIPSPSPQSNKTSTIVVPGKFDSFHIGHRQLTKTAARYGLPTLMSFSGMSTALRWKPRLPVVADVERDRVIREWSFATNVAISRLVVPFDQVCAMSPDEFLHFIVQQYGVIGIVCGEDWRFGKNRAGDVHLLRQLAPRYNLSVNIVQPVHLDGVVSSTRVRAALQSTDVQLAARLLDRYHRVVGYALRVEKTSVVCSNFVNMLPAAASYQAIVRVIGRAEPFRTTVTVFEQGNEPCVRVHDATSIYCTDCEIYIDFISRLPAVIE